MQTLPPAVTTILQTGRFSVRKALRIDLATGSTGLWSGSYTLTQAGVVYGACAGALVASDIPGTSGLGTEAVEVTLSGLDTAVRSLIAASPWHQRPAMLFDAYLDDAGAVFWMQPVFGGYLDTVEDVSQSDGTATIVVHLESNSRALGRSSGRTRSDADQRAVDPTDGFFKFVGAVAANPSIYWGRSGPQSPFGTS